MSRRRVCTRLLARALAIVPAFAQPALATGWLVDATEASGLDFQHFNGMTGRRYMPEMMGAGIAVFDYDNDGDLDVYLVQGRVLEPGKSTEDALIPPKHPPGIDRLFENLLDETGQLRFKDVTEAAGLVEAPGYGMGVIAGDANNDGWVDLYVTRFGPNQLLLNDGNGRFEDATRRAGVGDGGWGVSAAWVDFDRDGHLDLYVGNYLAYDLGEPKVCQGKDGAPDYCSPGNLPAQADRLYRNRGDGTFEDIAVSSRIGRVRHPALGVIAGDFNGDGWPDIYVANDGARNLLWINQRNGQFRDEALLAGVAVNMNGTAEASMGVDAADFDGDGDLDLFMTHLATETNTLYVNQGDGWFEDRSANSTLGHTSYAATGFGTGWIDLDNDGWLDLFSANGAVTRLSDQAGEALPLRQQNQLWANIGDGEYTEVTATTGPALQRSEVSRGVAFGDLDNDGDTDIVVANNSGPARVLRNVVGQDQAWIGLDLRDATGTHHALGAAVRTVIGERVLLRHSRTDGSYASSRDPRVLLGLGDYTGPELKLEVIWPDGFRQHLGGLERDQYHWIHRTDQPDQ